MNTINKTRQRVIISFLLSNLLCLLFIVPAINNRISIDVNQIENLLYDRSVQASEAISLPVNQLYTVASFINSSRGSLENIESLADAVVSSKHVRNLIIAPDGIVSYVYPMADGNEAVLGLNYYDNSVEGNKEAIIAAYSEGILLAGPFTTVLGDKAISGRLPVNLIDENGNKNFWGIISLTLDYPEIMESTGLENLSKQGYIYELWHTNVDTGLRDVIVSNGVINENDNYLDKIIKVQNASWCLRLAPLPKWYQYPETWVYIILSLAVSTTVSLMVLKNQQLHILTSELEHLAHYDSLTGLLNRQGLMNQIDNLQKNNKNFLVYYLDLNDFKDINDSFGHDAGDEVLREFGKRINKHLIENHFLCRMGGDEFILVSCSNYNTEEKMASFWEAVYQELQKPFILKG